jgi:acetyl esterase/lipase
MSIAARVVRALALLALLMFCLAVPLASIPPAHAADATVHKDIEYGEDRGRKLLLDVYEPSTPGSGRPGVILVHGGGWYRGDKSLWTTEGNDLAAMGWVGFAINYNMNQPRWPGEFQDVEQSITWVRQNASTYGVDPAKLGIIGSSAGAHLGVLAGVWGSGPLNTGTRVAAVVSWSAPYGLTELATNPLGPPEDGCSNANLPVCQNRVRIGEAVTEFLGCQPTACPTTYKDASPGTHIDPTDPPILLANSDMELIPLQQAQQAKADFDAKGVPNKLVIVPGHHHASQYATEIWQDTVSWLQTYIGTGAAPSSPTTTAPTTTTPPPTSTGSHSSSGTSFPVLPVVIGALVVLVIAVAAAALGRRRPGAPRPPPPPHA